MIEDSGFYYLYNDDADIKLQCNIDKHPTDATDLDDFEDNYKSSCNQIPITKTAATTPINEHCMQPWGCEKGYYKTKNDAETGDFVCAITLGNS
jgi:hypothetical protein